MTAVRERARLWLQSQVMSHGGCIERLEAVQNDAVNLQAQAATIGRMRGEREMFEYLLEIVESTPRNAQFSLLDEAA